MITSTIDFIARKFPDLMSVWAVSCMALVVDLTDIDLILKIFVSILAISYTTWRWRVEYKKQKDGAKSKKGDQN